MENTIPAAPAPTAPVAPRPELDSFGTLWGLTWKQYQSRFRLLFPIALIATSGSIVASILTAGAPEPDKLTIGMYLLTIVLSIVASVLSGPALVYAVIHPEVTSLAAAYRGGLSRFGGWFLAGLLTGLIVFGGFLLLVIPGIIWGIMFMFAAYLVFRENLGATDALKRSKELVNGRWFDLFWRQLVLALVIFGISFALGFFSSLAVLGNEPYASILGDLVTALMAPISVLFLHFLYETLYRAKAATTPTV